MYQLVIEFRSVVLSRTGPQIAIIVDIAFQVTVHRCDHAETPDIELAILVQSRTFNILLQYVSPILLVLILVNDVLYFTHFGMHRYPLPPIGVLSWLQYPNVFALQHTFLEGHLRFFVAQPLFALFVLILYRLRLNVGQLRRVGIPCISCVGL